MHRFNGLKDLFIFVVRADLVELTTAENDSLLLTEIKKRRRDSISRQFNFLNDFYQFLSDLK